MQKNENKEQDYYVPFWQLKQARKVQIRLLPQSIPDWNCLSFSYEYQTLDPIGGDYLDFFDIKNNKKGLLIADVSGHGIPAAIITAMAKMSFSNHAEQTDSPKEILKRVNHDLFKLLGDSGYYLTACFLVIDQELKISYSSAGHPALIYYNNNEDRFYDLKTKGLFIGSFEDAWETYEEKELQLRSGDRLILYTDGIEETKNSMGEMYGNKRLKEAIQFAYSLPSDKLAQMLIHDVRKYAGDEPIKDDMSILVVEVSLHFDKFLQHYQQGKKYLETNNPRWIKEFKKALEYNQDNYEVSLNLGKYYFRTKKFSEAKQCFERLIKNKILDPQVAFYLARIFMEEKKYLKSIALFKEILKNHDHIEAAWNNLAYCYFAIGKNEEALKIYENLAQKYPEKKHYPSVCRFLKNKIQPPQL